MGGELQLSTLPRVGEMNAPGRLLLGLLSITALAWLAIALSDMRALDRAAAARAAARLGPAATASPIRDTERAVRLRPGDTQPLIERAQLLLFARRPRAAKSVIEDVVRQEPRNARAWVILALISYGIDRRRSLEAAAHVEALDPRGSAARRR